MAGRAGVSIGSVQHYFDTREKLLLEAFEDWRHRALQPFNEVLKAEISDGERLQRLLLYAATADPGPSAVVWLAFCVSATRLEDMQARVQSLFDTWHSGIENAIAACSRRKKSDVVVAGGVATLVISMHFGRAVLSTLGSPAPPSGGPLVEGRLLPELARFSALLGELVNPSQPLNSPNRRGSDELSRAPSQVRRRTI